ncbi:hypothetical protein [Cucumibacter marinus]|uniref:hypothetical protein n=1 Tax=Cucumibacter marinus TaxID=1121252 RepID=UPI0004031DA0|nr:hypothetical protein [Cucumibacter marinus]
MGASWLKPAVFLVLFLVSAWMNFNFIHHTFEVRGYLLDIGWFATLFERTGFDLANPRAINDLSYFTVHLSPYMLVFSNLLHGGLGLSGVSVFALHQALSAGVISVSLLALVASARPAGSRRVWPLVPAAILILLNNVVLAAFGYPHFEVVQYAVLLAALALAARQHWRWVAMLMVLSWVIREDSGLLCAALVTALALEGWLRRDKAVPAKGLLALAGLSLIVAAAAITIKSTYFSEVSPLADNFLGHPAFAHLNAGFVAERLAGLSRRIDLMAPLAACLMAAIIWRRPGTLLVPLGLSPLIALYLIAVREELGAFTLYYALPFVLITAWPFYMLAKLPNRRWRSFIAMTVMLFAMTAPVVSLTDVRATYFPLIGIIPAQYDSAQARAALEERLDQLRSEDPGADICASQGVAALSPDSFANREVLRFRGAEPCDFVLYFQSEWLGADYQLPDGAAPPEQIYDGRIRLYRP